MISIKKGEILPSSQPECPGRGNTLVKKAEEFLE